MMYFWSLSCMLMTCCSRGRMRSILLILRLSSAQPLKYQIWGHCIIIWAFNFDKMMMKLHCCRQSTLSHCCIVLILRIVNLLLCLWKQVCILVFMMQGSTLMQFSISRLLDVSFMYALRGRTYSMLCHR